MSIFLLNSNLSGNKSKNYVISEKYSKLSGVEKLAFDAIYDYKNNLLKNPESLQIHSIKYFDQEFWDALGDSIDGSEISGTYIMFDNSAQNQMGGLTRDVVVYHDGNFVASSVKDYNGKEDTADFKTNILFLSWKYDDAKTIDINVLIDAGVLEK